MDKESKFECERETDEYCSKLERELEEQRTQEESERWERD